MKKKNITAVIEEMLDRADRLEALAEAMGTAKRVFKKDGGAFASAVKNIEFSYTGSRVGFEFEYSYHKTGTPLFININILTGEGVSVADNVYFEKEKVIEAMAEGMGPYIDYVVAQILSHGEKLKKEAASIRAQAAMFREAAEVFFEGVAHCFRVMIEKFDEFNEKKNGFTYYCDAVSSIRSMMDESGIFALNDMAEGRHCKLMD